MITAALCEKQINGVAHVLAALAVAVLAVLFVCPGIVAAECHICGTFFAILGRWANKLYMMALSLSSVAANADAHISPSFQLLWYESYEWQLCVAIGKLPFAFAICSSRQ